MFCDDSTMSALGINLTGLLERELTRSRKRSQRWFTSRCSDCHSSLGFQRWAFIERILGKKER